jgi:predicted signal transduction protein with EAL and GGDEF domain
MLDLVTELGCDVGQGYFIATPKPPQKLSFRGDAPAVGTDAGDGAIVERRLGELQSA